LQSPKAPGLIYGEYPFFSILDTGVTFEAYHPNADNAACYEGNPKMPYYRTPRIVIFKKKDGWGFQIAYTERGSERTEGSLDTYPTEALAEQAGRRAFAKLAQRWNL
jgi:hypothetical protein